MRRHSHFWNAFRFLTVLPAPASSDGMAPDWLTRSLPCFPVIGILIGTVSAMVLLLADLMWGHTLAALSAVAASIALTGALHEDGLADTFDSFGGGWTVAKRLEIMKDSRIGTYGALALGLGVALRVAALAALPIEIAAVALIAGHAAARAAPAVVMTRMNYAGDVTAMRVAYAESKPRVSELLVVGAVVVVAALPLMWLAGLSFVAGYAGALVLGSALAAWSKRLLGGYTGDVLGAIEQCGEVGFLLGVLAVVG
ncbi:MAG: cobalamin-5-phosphate synthase [Tardiphaga sp.]|nr:cobalamin-5-phosphate synthase [Tardiphaga sp.]